MVRVQPRPTRQLLLVVRVVRMVVVVEGCRGHGCVRPGLLPLGLLPLHVTEHEALLLRKRKKKD